MSALDWMMKAYPEVKEREDMRRIIGRYGLTGTQQVLQLISLLLSFSLFLYIPVCQCQCHCHPVRVATNLENLEYSGISLNMENSGNSVQRQGKIVTKYF